MDKISIIVPCYNEEASLPLFYDEITSVMSQMNTVEWELCFIDDGSADRTLPILRELSQKDPCVRFCSFSRNFGKEAAMFAGFQMCTGNYAAVMDADMQDPPRLLPEMYDILQTGEYDSVATRRVSREGEPRIRSFFARMFYRIINRISKADIVDGARDFRLMKRCMIDAILSLGEYNRFSKGIFGWIGFRTKWLEYKNVERAAGETKWSFWSLFLYSLDGIVAFSTAPLLISSFMGMICCMIAVIMMVVVVVKTLIFGDPVGGWPSMMSVILLLGGLQLFSIGILGQYLEKTYLETKKRPIYLVKETEEGMK
ncbi:MAG: glycosyltransferase family 2 protein [Clostridia bacterium]|nr:glycosyltransferase family 2 protein [Clostridia bacterium]